MDENTEEDVANYLPTPAEIEAACLEIQATWPTEERQRRGGPVYVETWSAPQYLPGYESMQRVG